MSFSIPNVELSEPLSDTEIKKFRQRNASHGSFDCLRVSISLPEEDLYGGTTTCIHERTLMGPSGTIEDFASELDKLIEKYCAGH